MKEKIFKDEQSQIVLLETRCQYLETMNCELESLVNTMKRRLDMNTNNNNIQDRKSATESSGERKHQDTHYMIIGGDINEDLGNSDRINKRKDYLKKFVKETGLKYDNEGKTFVKVNGEEFSELDFFLHKLGKIKPTHKPRYKAKPKLNVWSPDIKLALDEMRIYYAQWVKQGNIKDPENNIYQQRLRTRKEFRRQVRIKNAKVKDSEKQRIMETMQNCSGPANEALPVEEVYRRAKDNNQGYELVLLCAKSAFDVVIHSHLMKRLYHAGIDDKHWTIIQSMYTNATSAVKWNGQTSELFNVLQGVRQGGILSTDLYKLYINPLLNMLETSNLGCRIGNILFNTSACADDAAPMSKKTSDMQV
ncbi:unnamed protein product [Mytilus coruscus]|uniref:Reverse transcriptase domain-containing protein n=1 Tax=Mytilus coruscus TaxID=42192 RepID=A0A6J8D3V6_MYTCO|nr:unnamed protein product [Mytilus coruscus]